MSYIRLTNQMHLVYPIDQSDASHISNWPIRCASYPIDQSDASHISDWPIRCVSYPIDQSDASHISDWPIRCVSYIRLTNQMRVIYPIDQSDASHISDWPIRCVSYIRLTNQMRLIFISYRPETRGIPQKITLRDEIFRGRSPRNISSRRVIFCGIPRVKGL